MTFIRPCFDANGILQLNNSGWAIDTIPVTAPAFALNAINTFNGSSVYFSQLTGNDVTGNGSEFNPFATLTAAYAYAVSVIDATNIVCVCLDSANYDQNLIMDVTGISIYAPYANLFSSTGDTFTINADGVIITANLIQAYEGGSNAVNVFHGTPILYFQASFGGSFATNNASMVMSCSTVFGDIVVNGPGNIVLQTLQQPGGTFYGNVTGFTPLGCFGNWNVANNLSVDGLANDNIGGTFTSSIISGSINAGNLASGGQVSILPVNVATAQYQITGITLNGVSGTNFSGALGDRDLVVTDGTNVWTTIPAAILQSFAGSNALWGSTFVPLPTTIDMSQLSVAGQQIQAMYANGTTDYSAGAFSINLQYARLV